MTTFVIEIIGRDGERRTLCTTRERARADRLVIRLRTLAMSARPIEVREISDQNHKCKY